MTREQVHARYAEVGWLKRPMTDPLRQLAERKIAAFQKPPQSSILVAKPSQRADKPGLGVMLC